MLESFLQGLFYFSCQKAYPSFGFLCLERAQSNFEARTRAFLPAVGMHECFLRVQQKADLSVCLGEPRDFISSGVSVKASEWTTGERYCDEPVHPSRVVSSGIVDKVPNIPSLGVGCACLKPRAGTFVLYLLDGQCHPCWPTSA